jgi:hypothetical protein
VLIGADAETCGVELAHAGGLVASGDAAARVLERAGFAIVAIRPEHGRLVRCVPDVGTPELAATRPFRAMRYATLDLGPIPSGLDADRASEAASRDAAGERHPVESRPERDEASAADWRVGLRDEQGRALALADAQRRIVCLLFRPESLLCDPEALVVLRAALRVAAAPVRPLTPPAGASR